MGMHTTLRVPFAHALAPAAAALDCAQDAIDIRGSAPFLMRQHVDTQLLLSSLHQVDVGQHAVFLVRPGQFRRDSSRGVQARE